SEELAGDCRALDAVRERSCGAPHAVKPGGKERNPHLAVGQGAALSDLPAGPRAFARPIVPVIHERALPRRVAEERENVIGGALDEALVVLAHGYGCRATPVPRSSRSRN